MSNVEQYERHVAELSRRLQRKLNLRPAPFATLVSRSRKHLPRRIYKHAMALVEAEQFIHHPKLSRSLDAAALARSKRIVADHLDHVDLADERIGKIVSVLGSVSINLIAVAALVVAVLMWRGYL